MRIDSIECSCRSTQLNQFLSTSYEIVPMPRRHRIDQNPVAFLGLDQSATGIAEHRMGIIIGQPGITIE